jgi:hypothetical protein
MCIACVFGEMKENKKPVMEYNCISSVLAALLIGKGIIALLTAGYIVIHQ